MTIVKLQETSGGSQAPVTEGVEGSAGKIGRRKKERGGTNS
jgi:hypothetical protein